MAELERLTAAATPGPWIANIEEEAPIGGESMIELWLLGDFPPDMYVFHDGKDRTECRYQVHRRRSELHAPAAG